jgi:hypothetical protein
MGPKGECMTFCSPNHSFFPFGLGCFLPCVMHQVDYPPSFSPWVDSLHLWATFRFREDPPSSLFSWWERIAFNYVIWDAFASITRDTRFHVMCEQTNVFSMPSFYFLIDILTSCYQLMAIAPWPMLPLPIPFKHIWFCVFLHSMGSL